MMNYFILDDIPSSDYNVVISGESTWGAPERDIETIEVPGKNGALFVDNNRFKNVTFEYSCAILDTWKHDFPAFKAKMMAHSTKYYRLDDTYHPDEYLMARVSNVSDITYDNVIRTGTFKLQFDRKPQRFLKKVDKPIFTSSGVIYNPTDYASNPVLRVYGNGTLTIGSLSLKVANNSNYIDIDTEIMEAYTGSTNQNGNVTLPESFVINPGNQTVTLTGITKVEIDPRWWTV